MARSNLHTLVLGSIVKKYRIKTVFDKSDIPLNHVQVAFDNLVQNIS